MDIIKYDDLKWNGELIERTSTDFLIYHHSESSIDWTIYDIHKCHQVERAWIGGGYNIVVYPDGSKHELRPLWACDADAYGYNKNSLSVCFVGNFNTGYMTDAQIKSAIEIARWALGDHPKIKILRHCDVNKTECPGINFPMTEILKRIEVVNVTLDEAIQILVDEKVLNGADYRKKVCDVVNYEKEFTIAAATKIRDLKALSK